MGDRTYELTEPELVQWHDQGFVLRQGLFEPLEVEALLADGPLAASRCAEAAQSDQRQYFMYHNASGDTLSIYAGLDHTGTCFEAMCTDPRLVDPAFQLFGPRQYIHHAKFMNKKAFEGIAWLWHQDYGYWQTMGSIRPEMFSAMVFLDRAYPDNGCLNVIPGSHKLGRLPHREDGDTGGELPMTFLANATMKEICARMKPVAVLAEPGDVLLFDCNLMHSSGHNLSPDDRRAAIVAYNTDSNRPEAHAGWPVVQRSRVGDILRYRRAEDWTPAPRGQPIQN